MPIHVLVHPLRVDVVHELARRRQLAEEPLAQVLSETRSVRLRKAAVLVEVEARDLIPRDVELNERLQKLKLRCARRDDDARAALASDSGLDLGRDKRGGSGAERLLVGPRLDCEEGWRRADRKVGQV